MDLLPGLIHMLGAVSLAIGWRLLRGLLLYITHQHQALGIALLLTAACGTGLWRLARQSLHA